MEDKIKELRVKIDGLVQLTKGLKPFTFPIVLDLVSIPDGWDIQKWLYLYKEEGVAYIDTFNGGKGVTVINPPQELLKAVDSLLLAKAWLGKVLEELGDTSPYKNDGKRSSVDDIEDTADTAPTEISPGHKIIYDKLRLPRADAEGRLANHIEIVDYIREETKHLDTVFYGILWNGQLTKGFQEFEYSKKYLAEARFWLGFELGRIKEESNDR